LYLGFEGADFEKLRSLSGAFDEEGFISKLRSDHKLGKCNIFFSTFTRDDSDVAILSFITIPPTP
jgi:hypothetical protein